MEKWLTRLGLLLCAAVVGGSLLLLGVRAIEGPRTLVHVAHPCPAPKQDSTCVTDHYEGSWLVRPWLIVGITLTICAAGVAPTLLLHLKQLRADEAVSSSL